MTHVSIFMASYNHGRFIRPAIQSVLDQTHADFTLHIVDDASTDDSWDVIQSFHDPRIRASRNAQNRNDKRALRAIIDQTADGEYVAVHHSDNLWAADKLSKQVSFLETHPVVGAVFTRAHVIDADGRAVVDGSNFYRHIFDQPNRSRHAWLNFFFHHGNALCHPSVLIRKECYRECGSYRDGLGLLADLDMWVRLCLRYEIHVLPEKLVEYRLLGHDRDSSGDRPETRIRDQFERLQVLDNFRQITSFDELLRVFPSARAYARGGAGDVGYALARTALDGAESTPALGLFGLQLLFEALCDEKRAAALEQMYGFTHKEFVALTGRYDVFSMEAARLTRRRVGQLAMWLGHVRDAVLPANGPISRALRRLMGSSARRK